MQIVQALNAAFILSLLLAAVVLAVWNTCASYPPRVTQETIDSIDRASTVRFVNSLNIVSNLVLVVGGLVVLTIGFPLEAAVFLLAGVFSMLWHASGQTLWKVMDYIFSILSLFVLACLYLRIVQVASWPLLSALYLFLPLLGVVAYGAVLGGESDSTDFLNGRIAHVCWHLLGGAAIILIALEYLRVPCLVRNPWLRRALLAREARMWAYARKTGYCDTEPPWSSTVGFFQDIAAKKPWIDNASL